MTVVSLLSMATSLHPSLLVLTSPFLTVTSLLFVLHSPVCGNIPIMDGYIRILDGYIPVMDDSIPIIYGYIMTVTSLHLYYRWSSHISIMEGYIPIDGYIRNIDGQNS